MPTQRHRKSLATKAAACIAISLSCTPAAWAIEFNFASAATSIQQTLSPHYTDLGSDVKATAYEYHSTEWKLSELWARSETNDHGLGVCSTGEANCTPSSTTGRYVGGGGDRNELSNQLNPEAILLTRPVDSKWTSLWVSSLDGGGSDGSEEGVFYYGDSLDIATLLAGTGKTFSYSGGATVEFALDALIDDAVANSKYILFTHLPRDDVGDNNDYLVWKGAIERVPEEIPGVPVPAPLALLGIGSLALGWMTRKARG